MSITVNSTILQALQNSVAEQYCTGNSPTSGFFFTSPLCRLITACCFTQVTQPAAEGADLQGKFQQKVHHAFAEVCAAGIKQPLLCGAIPLDTKQPSALFIPDESRCFNRAAFVAGGIAAGNQARNR